MTKLTYEDKVKIYLERKEGKSNKLLLMMELAIVIICSVVFFIVIVVSSFCNIDFIPRIILIITAAIVFIIGLFFAMKLEREAGYYECSKCHKRSWNKKVLTK